MGFLKEYIWEVIVMDRDKTNVKTTNKKVDLEKMN